MQLEHASQLASDGQRSSINSRPSVTPVGSSRSTESCRLLGDAARADWRIANSFDAAQVGIVLDALRWLARATCDS
jgi:hypothetical protein